jgi:aspartyl-tRNA(Asn)/glutamyl-tRNA(Gln) amidotransferase subunit A
MLGTYALSAGYYDAYYLEAQRVRRRVRRDFLDVFATGVDLLLTPTTPSTAFRLGEKVDDPLAMYLSDLYTTPVNLAGLPAVSVPLGTDGGGLPVGGQLIGPDFGEESVCRAAAVVEQRFPPMQPPGFA